MSDGLHASKSLVELPPQFPPQFHQRDVSIGVHDLEHLANQESQRLCKESVRTIISYMETLYTFPPLEAPIYPSFGVNLRRPPPKTRNVSSDLATMLSPFLHVFLSNLFSPL